MYVDHISNQRPTLYIHMCGPLNSTHCCYACIEKSPSHAHTCIYMMHTSLTTNVCIIHNLSPSLGPVLKQYH